MKLKTILAAAAMLAALPATAGTTVPALDQPQVTVTTDSGWRVSTSLYGWTTRLDGDMTIHGTTIPVDVPFNKLFDELKFTFMGLVEVGKGKGPEGRSYSDSADKTWVDPIIGFRVHHDITDKFFVRALADIGGFGISSDLTWQAMASLGYRINDKASVGLGYRAISTDFTSGGTTYDVTSHGLLLGLEYRF
jgi:hypothetical protein